MILHEDWEFNTLGVYNYRRRNHLRHYFDFIIEHHDYISGDICEAGVYKGSSLLATGLLLKELGSDKRVYGYDSFVGFPLVYDEQDDFSKFELLFQSGRISREHLEKSQRLQTFRSLNVPETLSPKNISLSGDFSSASLDELKKKIEFLELENVHLVEGPFSETMADSAAQDVRFMAALVDCDLYQSYKVVLPFVWQRLSRGGYLYLDEYYSLKFPGARIATDEFFSTQCEKPQKHKPQQGDFERWYVRKLYE